MHKRALFFNILVFSPRAVGFDIMTSSFLTISLLFLITLFRSFRPALEQSKQKTEQKWLLINIKTFKIHGNIYKGAMISISNQNPNLTSWLQSS